MCDDEESSCIFSVPLQGVEMMHSQGHHLMVPMHGTE